MISEMEAITCPIEEALQKGLGKENLLDIYRRMARIRRFEKKVEDLFLVEGVLIGPCHLYLGQEAVAAGSVYALDEKDTIVTTYRGHGHAIAREVPLRLIMAELFGKATGTCRGIGGSMHAAMYPEKGLIYATAIVGSGIPITVGVGLAFKKRKERQVAVTYFGDGASNTGAFHEGLNLAALWKLPIVFICENNLYGMSTRVDRSLAGMSVVNRSSAYDMRGLFADGNDALAVHKATTIAREYALQGEGPVLIECLTYKQRGHGVYDKGEYRSKQEVEEWLKKDAILKLREQLLSKNVSTLEEIKHIEDAVEAEVADAVEFAIQSPFLPFDELWKLVYSEVRA